MKKKVWGLCALVMLLLVSAALADGGTYAGLDDERSQTIEWLYPGVIVEDYSEIAIGDLRFSFILFWHEGKQALDVDYMDENQNWSKWFVTEQGLPQGETARLETDGQTITIAATDREGKRQSVTYTWDAQRPNRPSEGETPRWAFGGFVLAAYDDVRAEADGMLHFADGDAKVTMLTDMRYINYENLPKTLEDARENDDVPPGFCFYDTRWATLFGQVMTLSPDHSRKVYLGPGSGYPRAGNGKAAVGTNGWVQVFGRYKGYLLIQYHVDGDHYRIGWINDSALPAGAKVKQLDINDSLPEGVADEEIVADCVLTDDPMGSGAAIAQLKAGQKVKHRAFLGGDWELISVKIDGKVYWGFVPGHCMTHG